MINALRREVRKKANPKRARNLAWFFKTGKGEYGEGDVFVGLTVPESRKIAYEYRDLKLSEVQELLKSKVHEERLIALFVLVRKFQSSPEDDQKKIYNFYLKSTKYINNWDLVDLSSHKIIGAYLLNKPKNILYKLAKSKNLWEKRIAIISTAHFISEGKFEDTLKIAGALIKDSHDLIHKAVGWMLREVGKKNRRVEEKFLKKHYQDMPRTMLRYSIEKFPEKDRKLYLNGRI